ncbi:MAG TPA: BON domain-containing protein [Casimicrobiaceae bacterium]
MKNSLQYPRLLSTVAIGAALGAATMFIFDPNKGRRRRALVRDRARRSLMNAGHLLHVSARDLGHRARGVRATVRRFLKGNRVADDLVLIERVRAKMGRVVSHPHAIQIGARDGRVTLSGPILPAEAEPLLDTVRSVWGVSGVEDHLVIFDRPDSIPSLQGGRRNADTAQSRHAMGSSIGDVVAILAGGALALCAVRARGPARIGLAAAGVGLATRGATNKALLRTARNAWQRPTNGDRRTNTAFDTHAASSSASTSEGVRASLH